MKLLKRTIIIGATVTALAITGVAAAQSDLRIIPIQKAPVSETEAPAVDQTPLSENTTTPLPTPVITDADNSQPSETPLTNQTSTSTETPKNDTPTPTAPTQTEEVDLTPEPLPAPAVCLTCVDNTNDQTDSSVTTR